MRRVFHRERAERSRAELQRSEPPCGKPVGAAMLLKLCVLQPPKKRALGAGGIFGPEQVCRFRSGGPGGRSLLPQGVLPLFPALSELSGCHLEPGLDANVREIA